MTGNTDPDDAAFARPSCETADEIFSNHQRGLTKRELFAAMAMQGILSAGDESILTVCSKRAIDAADYLIWELNNKDQT